MPRRPHEPQGRQEREDGAAWMAEPLSEAQIHAGFGDSLAADSARALVAAQVLLDDLLLSRNLHHELRAMGIEPWGDRQRPRGRGASTAGHAERGVSQLGERAQEAADPSRRGGAEEGRDRAIARDGRRRHRWKERHVPSERFRAVRGRVEIVDLLRRWRQGGEEAVRG